MSAYNILDVVDSDSGPEAQRLQIQFKFGDAWLHRYEVGDTIAWGGNDIGRPGLRRVFVKGSVVGPEGVRHYVVQIENDVITAWLPMDTHMKAQFDASPDPYIVAEE